MECPSCKFNNKKKFFEIKVISQMGETVISAERNDTGKQVKLYGCPKCSTVIFK